MSYGTYKLIHYLGIFLLVVAVAAMLSRAAWGGVTEGGPEGRDPWRGRLGALHGVALLLVLVGGFGLLARLGVSHSQLLPGWVFAKLTIWGLLVAMPFIARKRPGWAVPALLLLPLLGALAGALALYKPF
ncbi:MAG TPA: hypothetical protein VGA70_00840 [Longimicrobiales bacterium]|jgi:hypothetical protein